MAKGVERGFRYYLERDFGSLPTATSRENGYPENLPQRIDRGLLEACEDRLGDISRWREYGLIEGRSENDRDHTFGMAAWLDKVEQTCPALRREIDFKIARVIAGVHDVGEIVSGDLSLEQQRELGEEGTRKHKEKEKRATTLILLPQVQDLEVRKWLTDLYLAYEELPPEHRYIREALLAKLADKIQGNGTALRYGHPLERLGEVRKLINIHEHVVSALRKTEEVSKSLLSLLSTRAQVEVGNIAINIANRYSDEGFPEPARETVRAIRRIIPSVPGRMGKESRDLRSKGRRARR